MEVCAQGVFTVLAPLGSFNDGENSDKYVEHVWIVTTQAGKNACGPLVAVCVILTSYLSSVVVLSLPGVAETAMVSLVVACCCRSGSHLMASSWCFSKCCMEEVIPACKNGGGHLQIRQRVWIA